MIYGIGQMETARSVFLDGRGGPLMKYANGTIIEPAKVTKERTQSWSTSMSIGFDDILSLGVSTEFTDSVSSVTQVTVDIAEGQTGKLGFTATLSCSTGTGQCGGGKVEGEVCLTGPTMSGDDVAGTYRVIVES